MDTEKKNKSFFRKLHDKYRLIIMNDDTFEEKLNLRLSRFNVFIFAGTISILLVVATIYLIAFTPLREYIPGYADFNTRKVLRELSMRADSLESDLRQKDLYIMNIRNIVEGKDLIDHIPDSVSETDAYDIEELPRSKEDSILRAQIEEAEEEALFERNELSGNNFSQTQEFRGIPFFPPLTGMVSSHFDPTSGHYGVDVVADHDELIKATLDGTVIFSTWTIKTGYTIGVQHDNNIVSIYKHNSELLKDEGSFVESGEAIAVIGATGLYSTGTHLHFELWFNGNPVNPLDYLEFQ
ncbi:MAG: M23 family metallopeptidase [Bacteroidales bacterium]